MFSFLYNSSLTMASVTSNSMTENTDLLPCIWKVPVQALDWRRVALCNVFHGFSLSLHAKAGAN
jgi:hypothetical protein